MSHNEAENSSPTVESIEAEIRRTRKELAQTVDELTDRVDPRVKFRKITAQAKETANDISSTAQSKLSHVSSVIGDAAQKVKNQPLSTFILIGSACVVVAGATILVSSRRKKVSKPKLDLGF